MEDIKKYVSDHWWDLDLWDADIIDYKRFLDDINKNE